MNDRIRITVGPVLTYWPRNDLAAFYAMVADSTADTVVLGEVVCSRRHEMKPDDWLVLARELRAAGKEVVLASQVLLESETDLRLMRRLASQDEFLVEAGDASALRALAGRPFVLGPHINVYSRPALAEHAALGAVRWVAPVELGLDAVRLVNPPERPVPGGPRLDTPITTEVFAYGRLPLAFSARCFTARHVGVPKDQCGYPCRDDADGRLVRSTEGQPFLVLNGTQTQSAGVHNLLEHRSALQATGATHVRLSPHSAGFLQVIDDFDAVLNRQEPAAGRAARWADAGVPQPLVAGYAFGVPGMNAAPTETTSARP